MKYPQSISVFIPAYNEEKNLEAVSKEILDFLKKNFKTYEYIIVANKSKDRTSQIAKQIARKNKNTRVMQQKKFVGYGTQLITGWETAKHELIFYMDSDKQFDITELAEFMEHIPKYDVILGYRKQRNDPFMRLIYSFVYNMLVKILLNVNVKDVDCAFKFCKKKVIDEIKPLTQDRGSDAEFLVKSKAAGFKIKELPVTHKARISGVSEAETGNKLFAMIRPELVVTMIKETIYLRRFLR